MYIQIPVKTEVIEKNEDICVRGELIEGKIVIEIDAQKRDYKKILGLGKRERVEWINERRFDVEEVSCFCWPIVYRITTADGYYQKNGERVYFTPEIKGLSTQKKVTDAVVRLAVFLSIIVGLGCRKASWLMEVLFQVTTSKSAISRWIDDVASELPSPEEMVKLLNKEKEITEGHLDELFPLGTNACLLVLRDEHGRIVAAKEVENRDEKSVVPFLEWIKGLEIKIKTFYTDQWQAYQNAIEKVYPEANLQLDYFHILQNIWRHVWREFTSYRKTVKERADKSKTKWYAEDLKELAAQLWKNRYLFFKSEANLTKEEREKMLEIINTNTKVSFIRGFLQKVWSVFQDSTNEKEAAEKLEQLKQYAYQQDQKSGFGKSISFLEDHFKNMTTFLRVSKVKRNSLAETGMRVLRRLERNHDGFRSDAARQNALKIYQAVMYLGWSIHDPPNFKQS